MFCTLNLQPTVSLREEARQQRALNFNRALRCFQRTPEFDQEGVTNRFDFSAVKPRKDFPKQPAMFLQQFLGKLFVPLAPTMSVNMIAASLRCSVMSGISRNRF